MYLPPHVSAWALERAAKERPREAARLADLGAKLRGARSGDEERVLRAEIISTAIALIAWAAPGSVTIAGIGASTFLAVGLSIGLSYAAQALQSRGSSPLSNFAQSEQGSKYNERQAIPSKRILYGESQVGGALFIEVVKPPYLYMGFLICDEQVTSFRKMWIATNEVAFSGLTPNSVLTPIAVDGAPNYPGRLQASFRVGLPSQTLDGLLATDLTHLDASFRQQGVATVVARFHYGADYNEFTRLWGQVQRPNPLFLVRGVAVPDPRVQGTVLNWDPDDPASVEAARATWGYSNNASLVTAHYLTQRYGGRIKPSRMDWDKVVEAADFDDDMIACNDGTSQRRYTIDGAVTLNQSPSTVVAGMIAANRGYVLQSAGRVWPSSSKPRKTIATIHDGLLAGPVSIRMAKPKRDLINRVKTRFIAPDREYQTADGPVLTRTDLQEADGEVLDATLTLPFTSDNRRAQRLAKAYLSNARLGKQISCRVDVLLLAECDDDLIGGAVNFDSALFPAGNGLYLVADWGFADSFSKIDLSLVAYDPSVETDWVAANDEKPFTIADLNAA